MWFIIVLIIIIIFLWYITGPGRERFDFQPRETALAHEVLLSDAAHGIIPAPALYESGDSLYVRPRLNSWTANYRVRDPDHRREKILGSVW